MSERYPTKVQWRSLPAERWVEAAKDVLLAMLDEQHAVTVSEMEARASDRTWNPAVWPKPVDPHHFTTARKELSRDGVIVADYAKTRGGAWVTTWSFADDKGRRRAIEDSAARKRLLTARHMGWGRRGGHNLGLIGRAGENAVDTAMRHPAVQLVNVSGSTTEVLGTELIGEIDNSAQFVDLTEPSEPVALTVLVEVKNTRTWIYHDGPGLLRFLAKAAHLQEANKRQLILPVMVSRKRSWTAWQQGQDHGFLTAFVNNQAVLSDNELDEKAMAEVRDGLGFRDLLLGDDPTNRHVGIFRDSIPKYGYHLALKWQAHYTEYLIDPDDIGGDEEEE